MITVVKWQPLLSKPLAQTALAGFSNTFVEAFCRAERVHESGPVAFSLVYSEFTCYFSRILQYKASVLFEESWTPRMDEFHGI